MMYMIIRTASGKKYARRIGQELKRINPRNNWLIPSLNYFPTSFSRRPQLNPRNTIIHSRAAYPNCGWMNNLVRKEEQGFRVINSTDILKMTSNKGRCGTLLYSAELPHPNTLVYDRSRFNIEHLSESLERVEFTKVVVKPYTSMDQGANVEVVEIPRRGRITLCTCPTCGNQHEHSRGHIIDTSRLEEAIRRQPTNKVVIQEYVDYTAIYRVIVINGRALPISWVDRPTPNRWRVSVCLNRNMQFIRNPDTELLRVAERTQRVIGGEINFIDVFETSDGYVLSEINTACNLLLHEEKARRAGSSYWNIAAYIAEYLNEQGRRLNV